ncbi:MAG TPA: glucuronate isomerase [Stellaceae bacterium]|nr:glucuronate isomerase [Stellaceae bacterium]
MTAPLTLHADRLLPSDPGTRAIARRLYQTVRDLPIVSPHGHTDPRWFSRNEPFPNPSALFITPDHYVFRMLYSQGIPHEALGIPRVDGGPTETDPRKIWRLFASNFHLFRGTPTRMWLDHAFHETFGIRERLTADSADRIYDRIDECLTQDAFRPRALYESFGIEVIATTESPLDPLAAHQALRDDPWTGRVITAFRPDPVVDPEFPDFHGNLDELARITGRDTTRWPEYLAALADRRQFFKSMGATSTDHGHPTAVTSDLSPRIAAELFEKVVSGDFSAHDAELFRGQVLTEMARMSLEDGLVMQIHPGSCRGHNPSVMARFGRDKGADIPTATEYVRALKPLLDKFGNDPALTLILFTLDETSYSRELAPLAGHYPALRLGPAWWFYDAPEGMLRYRETVTETAGFYNTVGFNDDTRAFLSIPARHDVARRIDCAYLSRLVAEHRLDEDEAFEVARDLAYTLAKRTYKL